MEQTPQAKPQLPASLFWWIIISIGSWMIGSSLGKIVGYLIAVAVISQLAPRPGSGSGDFFLGIGMITLFAFTLLSSVMGGPVIGIVTGFVQSRFLRTFDVPARSWISASVIGWTLVSLLDGVGTILALSRSFLLLFMLVIAGSALLIPVYWLTLRERMPDARAYALGGSACYLIATSLTLGWQISALLFHPR